MEQTHNLYTDKIKLGKKGQITIPKKIRDEDILQEDDIFVVTHTASGDIILRKQNTHTPEDTILDAIKQAPKFNAKEAWQEILQERKRERV